MNFPAKVTLREVVTRDGFQSLSAFIPTRTKIEIINKILDSGVKEIEVTSFVSSKCIPQLSDASKLISFLPRDDVAIIYSALVPNFRGAEAAIAAGINRLVFVVSASNSHNRENIRKSISQSLSELRDVFDLARKNDVQIIGSIPVAFGCPYEGNIKVSDVLRIADAYISLGAISLILADTAGMATPSSVNNLLTCFQDEFSSELLTLHFHNNRGTAMANLLAALNFGVTSFDTALGGIGGCPYVPLSAGNLPTEGVVQMLGNMKINTGINLEKIIRAASFLEEVIGDKLG